MARYLILLALLRGLSMSAFAQAQSKLPPCPPVDYAKKTDAGKTEKWNKCFGKIVNLMKIQKVMYTRVGDVNRVLIGR